MNIQNVRKITTVAISAILAYSLMFGYFVIKDMVESFISGWNSVDNPVAEVAETNIISGLLAFPLVILWFAIIIMSIRMLLNIRKSTTPFTEQNGKSLRNIGVSMMIAEPLYLLSMLLDGYLNHNFCGVIFIVGTLLFCFSSVFRYGVKLQQESDETL